MSTVKLPNLENKLFLLKAYFTVFRRKSIYEDICLQESIEDIVIDVENLNSYSRFFDFKFKNPLSYFYLIAQKAQLSLMLNKEFGLPIPGMIHISNEIEKINEIDVNQPINLKSEVFVEAKEEGSLNPIFVNEFYQNGVLKLINKSYYLIRRKSVSKKKKTKKDEAISDLEVVINKFISQNDVNKYSKLSGDRNPIHTSKTIAKLFGLKSTIVHGWYLASLAFTEFGDENSQKFKVDFVKMLEANSEILISKSQKHQAILFLGKIRIKCSIF